MIQFRMNEPSSRASWRPRSRSPEVKVDPSSLTNTFGKWIGLTLFQIAPSVLVIFGRLLVAIHTTYSTSHSTGCPYKGRVFWVSEPVIDLTSAWFRLAFSGSSDIFTNRVPISE